MANADTAFGLKPVSHLNGIPWNGQFRIMHVPASDATAIYRGDPVKVTGAADSDGVATVAQAEAGDTPVGVMIGVIQNHKGTTPDLEKTYRPASTLNYVAVVVDPDVIFEIQEDSDGAALAAGAVFQNADIIVGSGSNSTGKSGVELDSSTANTTATLVLKIIDIVDREDNAIGNNAKWLVKFNLHEIRDTSGI
jgi:hypothetical protein